MIDERLEEQASLHVLGALSDSEAQEFKARLRLDPELQAYVARLSTATGALAGAVPASEPPPQLRAKVLARIEPPQKVVARPERPWNPFAWLPWAVAAGLAGLCVFLSVTDTQHRQTISVQARQIRDLNALAQSLQAATNELAQTVVALQETNRLADLKIAMLNSLMADAPKTVAVSLWDSREQNGVLVVQNLNALPADRDYELWVIEEGGAPVAASVFHLDNRGNARIEYKPSKLIKAAGKFAVTIEAKGGVASPTLKNLVLASN